MNFKLIAALAGGLLSAAPAFSAIVTLDFEGAGAYSFIDEYYNGGTNESGASGTNFGVSFGSAMLAVSNDADFTYHANAPTPGTIMSPTISEGALLNVASGFSGQASFFYSASLIEEQPPMSVSVWSGLNGTGSMLATFTLASNATDGCAESGIPFCNWDLATLDFSGVGPVDPVLQRRWRRIRQRGGRPGPAAGSRLVAVVGPRRPGCLLTPQARRLTQGNAHARCPPLRGHLLFAEVIA